MKLACIVLLGTLLVAPVVQAQMMPGRPNPDHKQTVSINFQINYPTKPDMADGELTRSMSEASRSLYDIVDHECIVLAASLKGSCRLVQMTIGGNAGNRATNNPVIFANVNATFEITPAPAVETPAAK
ncbi:hypothetical protein [Acidisphaera sp. L21]|uniref:hypothetical protein n=1 Tax=Acidisphaera sp. L21 TaxID=1641851 RepID=UPI00131C625D|nr:hypothetical protein [Acidisphaera sp. L21]